MRAAAPHVGTHCASTLLAARISLCCHCDSGAIVFTALLNAFFLDGPFTLPIFAGGVIVIVSVCNYNDPGDTEPS